MDEQLITNINLHLHEHIYFNQELTNARIRKYRRKLIGIVLTNPRLAESARKTRERVTEIQDVRYFLKKERERFQRGLWQISQTVRSPTNRRN